MPCPAPSGYTGRNRVSNRPRSGDRGPGDAERPPDWRARLPDPLDGEVPGYEFDVRGGRPGTGEFAALRDTGEFGAVRDTDGFGAVRDMGEFNPVRNTGGFRAAPGGPPRPVLGAGPPDPRYRNAERNHEWNPRPGQSSGPLNLRYTPTVSISGPMAYSAGSAVPRTGRAAGSTRGSTRRSGDEGLGDQRPGPGADRPEPRGSRLCHGRRRTRLCRGGRGTRSCRGGQRTRLCRAGHAERRTRSRAPPHLGSPGAAHANPGDARRPLGRDRRS